MYNFFLRNIIIQATEPLDPGIFQTWSWELEVQGDIKYLFLTNLPPFRIRVDIWVYWI